MLDPMVDFSIGQILPLMDVGLSDLIGGLIVDQK
jgi:hypothetical protein